MPWLLFKRVGLFLSTLKHKVSYIMPSRTPIDFNRGTVYPGMVIGESSKSSDLHLNPCVKKQLTNIRAAGADDKIVLASPRILTLEEALAYMSDDELVEVTPGSVRLRKKDLEAAKRGGKGVKSKK